MIGTYNAGLYLLEEKKKLSHLIPGGRVNDIYCDSMGDIWVSFHSGEGCILSVTGKSGISARCRAMIRALVPARCIVAVKMKTGISG